MKNNFIVNYFVTSWEELKKVRDKIVKHIKGNIHNVRERNEEIDRCDFPKADYRNIRNIYSIVQIFNEKYAKNSKKLKKAIIYKKN